MRNLAISLLSCAALMLPAIAHADVLRVRMDLSDTTLPYQQFATAFGRDLATTDAAIIVTEANSADGLDIDLVVAVGMKAAEKAAADAKAPVLAVMIPKEGFEELLFQGTTKKITLPISALFLDQPWDRQIDFLRAALPKHRRIGLLHSPDTGIDFTRLRHEVSGRGGTLLARPARSADRLFSSLDHILEEIDVLLAIPDSAIYTSSNIRNILLTSYRHGVPLVGLSQSYVNAGALCAIFSTPEQLALQVKSMVVEFVKSKRLPDSQYPADFTIAVNEQVARSLNIQLPSQEILRSRMKRAGGK